MDSAMPRMLPLDDPAEILSGWPVREAKQMGPAGAIRGAEFRNRQRGMPVSRQSFGPLMLTDAAVGGVPDFDGAVRAGAFDGIGHVGEIARRCFEVRREFIEAALRQAHLQPAEEIFGRPVFVAVDAHFGLARAFDDSGVKAPHLVAPVLVGRIIGDDIGHGQTR